LLQDVIKGLLAWAIGSLVLAVLVARTLRVLGQDVPTPAGPSIGREQRGET
jgi:hypothetical protein